jgi:hypothetical protein
MRMVIGLPTASSGISEEKLSAATPTHDDAVEILGKDRVDSTIAAVLRGAFATQTL